MTRRPAHLIITLVLSTVLLQLLDARGQSDTPSVSSARLGDSPSTEGLVYPHNKRVGKIFTADLREIAIPVSNGGKRLIEFGDFIVPCGCLGMMGRPDTLLPGEQSTLTLTLRPSYKGIWLAGVGGDTGRPDRRPNSPSSVDLCELGVFEAVCYSPGEPVSVLPTTRRPRRASLLRG